MVTMVTMLKRLFWLTLLAGAGFAGWALWSSARQKPPGAVAEGTPARAPVATAPAAPWVAPVDGACPEGYPIKANDNSGIYHAPGGRFYERTRPERCYATAEAAEADGYRRSKS
jgi:hypothetical protein